MRWAVALLLLAPAIAGCLLPGGSQDTDADNPAQASQSSTTTSGKPLVVKPGNGTKPAGNGTGLGNTTSGNGTLANQSFGAPREWPLPEAASIRPGASLNDGGCTANFVFTSPDNKTVYIGTAAHCFSNDVNTVTDGCVANIDELGARMKISGASKSGLLVYSSWATMQAEKESGSICTNNDFALLQIDADDVDKVSPALWHFGGPTGLAQPEDVSTFDRVLSYGNSGTRPEDSALSPREGYVTLPAGGCDSRVVFPNAAIPGDSGSPVLLGNGLAFGDFVSIELTPLPGQGHVCLLASLLEYAAEHGFPVQLATWELLDGGLLPP